MQTKKGAQVDGLTSGFTITIASGKGGVGKTNLAVNLAVALTAQNRRCLLIDADMGLANVDVLMNLQSRYHIGHFLNGQRQWFDIVQSSAGGVDIICGGSGLVDLANLAPFQRQRLAEAIRQTKTYWDYVILDAGAGIQSSVIELCMLSDLTVVVTTPEPTAMTDAYALIKVLHAGTYGGKIYLLVNMAQNAVEARGVYRQISDVASRFLGAAVYDAGFVSKDAAVCAAVRQRVPFLLAYPKSPASGDVMRVCARLTQHQFCQPDQMGLLKKVANWFS